MGNCPCKRKKPETRVGIKYQPSAFEKPEENFEDLEQHSFDDQSSVQSNVNYRSCLQDQMTTEKLKSNSNHPNDSTVLD